MSDERRIEPFQAHDPLAMCLHRFVAHGLREIN